MLSVRCCGHLPYRQFLFSDNSPVTLCGELEKHITAQNTRMTEQVVSLGKVENTKVLTDPTLCTSITIALRDPGLRSSKGMSALYSGVPNSCTVPGKMNGVNNVRYIVGNDRHTLAKQSHYSRRTLESIQQDCDPAIFPYM